MSKKNDILSSVNKYYSEKIISNGATPQGVDWNSSESQNLRFEVLKNVITRTRNFTLLDYGCGFGSMYDFLKLKYDDFSYCGYDISNEMINEALSRNKENKTNKWVTILDEGSKFDFVIASGLFNVKLNSPNDEWLEYIKKTLLEINALSINGFAFNVLTKYSDAEYMKDNLYYADPLLLFDFCKTEFSKNVAVLHDYNLYEFTIIVRKE
jgi:cyclopropane fatty-acyl-phospholipid synthase-like methyltransferase